MNKDHLLKSIRWLNHNLHIVAFYFIVSAVFKFPLGDYNPIVLGLTYYAMFIVIAPVLVLNRNSYKPLAISEITRADYELKFFWKSMLLSMFTVLSILAVALIGYFFLNIILLQWLVSASHSFLFKPLNLIFQASIIIFFLGTLLFALIMIPIWICSLYFIVCFNEGVWGALKRAVSTIAAFPRAFFTTLIFSFLVIMDYGLITKIITHANTRFMGLQTGFLFIKIYICFMLFLFFIFSIEDTNKKMPPDFTRWHIKLNWQRMAKFFGISVIIFSVIEIPFLLHVRKEDRIIDLTLQGDKFFDEKKYTDAERYYKRVVAIDNKKLNSYGGLISVYIKTKKYKKLVEICKRVIALDPKSSSRYVNLGFAYNKSGEYDKAINVLKTALSLDSRFPYVYYQMGESYYGKKNKKTAISMWKKAVDLGDTQYFELARKALKEKFGIVYVIRRDCRNKPISQGVV